jgi:transcriptional regulator with XRE-family HTH domain
VFLLSWLLVDGFAAHRENPLLVEPDLPPAAGETIGQRLKRLRQERGFSQRELAAPGVSYAYISRIEAGSRQPSVKALRKLAAKLGVAADYLETGSELDPAAARELRLSDLELAIRLGNASAAEHELSAILADALAAADAPCAFRARVALAALCERDGQLAAAIELLESALANEPFAPSERVDAYADLARIYGAAGRTRQAIELLERCLDASEGVASAEGRYAALLSYALTDAGDIARAEQIVHTALDHLRDSQDPYMRVRLYWSLARLAAGEGRSKTALANIRKAIALLESTEDAISLGRAHLIASAMLIERGDSRKASGHLDQAERMLVPGAVQADVIEITIQRSRIARLDRDGDRAVALAREALSLEPGAPDRGDALAALADGLALNDDPDAADGAYRDAVEILEAQRRWRPAANACRAWARMLREHDREADALDVLDRAAELATRAAPAHADR